MSKIFQHNSYTTLYGGFYEGTITAEEALRHGNCGIGTLDGADGEVIILDGMMYHGNSEKNVRIVNGEEMLPYVAVLEHEATHRLELENAELSSLLSVLMAEVTNKNIPYSVKIAGTFNEVEITSKPDKNGTTPYLDILAHQPHYTARNITGTIIGLWSPKHLETLYGNGFHLHFISDDKVFGAHLTNFYGQNLQVEFGEINEMTQEFSHNNAAFNQKVF